MKKKRVTGTIVYYHNDMPIGCKQYRDKADRDNSLGLFLKRIQKMTNGLFYYTISPKIIEPEIIPEIVNRRIERHKAKRGINVNHYGRVVDKGKNHKPFDDKR